MNNPPAYLPVIPGGSVYPPRPMYAYPSSMAVPQQSFPDDDDSESDEDPNNKKVKGKGGSSCHQCKSRRNFTALSYCTSLLDKKNKKCRKKFCGHCLKKFYKEQAAGPAEKHNWTCPSCRRICCCAACRRRKDKDDGSPVVGAVGMSKKRKKRDDDSDDSDDDDYMYAHGIPQMSHGGVPGMGLGAPAYGSAYGAGAMSAPMGMSAGMAPGMGGGMGAGMGMSHMPGMSKPITKSEPRFVWSEDGTDALDISALAARYPALVQEYVRRAAYMAAQDPHNAFAQLYAYAQSPFVRQRIDMVLHRPDMDKTTKVEFIADILRTGSGAAMHAASVAAPAAHAHAARAMYSAPQTDVAHATAPVAAPMAMPVDRSVGVGRIPHAPAAVKNDSPNMATAASASASASTPAPAAAPAAPMFAANMSRPGSTSGYPPYPHIGSPATPLAYLYGLSPPVMPRTDLTLPPLPSLPGAQAAGWQGVGLHSGVASALTPSVATHPRLAAMGMGVSPMLAPKHVAYPAHGLMGPTGIGHGLTTGLAAGQDARAGAAAGADGGAGAGGELSGALASALKGEEAEKSDAGSSAAVQAQGQAQGSAEAVGDGSLKSEQGANPTV